MGEHDTVTDFASRKDRIVATAGERVRREYDKYLLNFMAFMQGIKPVRDDRAEAFDHVPRQRLAELETRNALID